ncbi:MAG: hypothetical protein IKS52_02180, partial [Clostridia bacterium]|nr:hypothetical protein [Clostridia bacterium]
SGSGSGVAVGSGVGVAVGSGVGDAVGSGVGSTSGSITAAPRPIAAPSFSAEGIEWAGASL